MSDPETLPPTRRTYACLAAAFLAFAIYGSWVPLHFVPIPCDEAVERFSQAQWLALGVGSRSDLVANLLLFLPIGFLATGALRADRRGAAGLAAAGLAVAIGGAALAVGIEFSQVYFPGRTVSWNDVAAETSGGALGALGWAVAGPAVTAALRDFFSTRTRTDFRARILQVYAAGFLFSQLMPFDVTIDLGELAQKRREGRINLVPFVAEYGSIGAAIWDVAGDVLLYAPIGALALLGWAPRDGRRTVARAALLGTACAALVEAAQLFIFSRSADTGDVITGGVGVTLGALAAARYIGAPGEAEIAAPEAGATESLLDARALACAAAWACALAAIEWWPLEFRLERSFVKERIPMLFSVPFAGLYAGSDFHTFVEVSRKSLLAFPLGALLRAGLRRGRSPAQERLLAIARVGLCAAVLVAIEVGQVLTPSHYPDLTDVMIELGGALAGVWVARRWLEVETGPRYSCPPETPT